MLGSIRLMNIKLLFILFALTINLNCFYISKQPVPTLFLNQQFRFNITHNAGQNINFKLISGPSFLSLQPNGEMIFHPNNQGSFQAFIQCFNATTNMNIITLSYVLNVLKKLNQVKKPLWILNQTDYFNPVNDSSIIIQTNIFDFHSSILTNQNILLKLITKNQIGSVVWFYENLPQTIVGSKTAGKIQGYVQNEGTYIIKVTAIDSTFKLGQIYVSLRFVSTPLSLQHQFSEYNWKNTFFVQQKQQNATLIENDIKSLINVKNDQKLKRINLLGNYNNLTLSRQGQKSKYDLLTQNIKQKNNQKDVKTNQKKLIQTNLTNQKFEVNNARKILSSKQNDYANKLSQSKSINRTKQQIQNKLHQYRAQLSQIKASISDLQTSFYQQDNDLQNIQYEKSRNNITYVTYQKQQVRTRQILQIRKNLQFQYLIKKTQTDNKVRRNQDYVFLAQTNYDFAYAEYKKQSLIYLQNVIQSSYLQSQIELVLKDYDYMNKTLNKVKLNYAIAAGAVDTLKVAKQQLSRLAAYTLNSTISSLNSTNLTQTQIIQAQVKAQVKQYPFTGCQKIGTFSWAGSGKIKTIGQNSFVLGSQQTVNYGKCTQLKTKIQQLSQLQIGTWIKFNGYYWDGAIQATSITLLSKN